MLNDEKVIDTLDELAAFITLAEQGALGMENVAGIALATNNSDGRPFIAVLDDNHQLLTGRWVSQYVFDNGKDLVRKGSGNIH